MSSINYNRERAIHYHEECVRLTTSAFNAAVKAGEYLIKIRRVTPHFCQWCDENLPFSRRTAYDYIDCVEARCRTDREFVSIREALRFLGTIPRRVIQLTKMQRIMLQTHIVLQHAADQKACIEAIPYAIRGSTEIPAVLVPYVRELTDLWASTSLIK